MHESGTGAHTNMVGTKSTNTLTTSITFRACSLAGLHGEIQGRRGKGGGNILCRRLSQLASYGCSWLAERATILAMKTSLYNSRSHQIFCVHVASMYFRGIRPLICLVSDQCSSPHSCTNAPLCSIYLSVCTCVL